MICLSSLLRMMNAIQMTKSNDLTEAVCGVNNETLLYFMINYSVDRGLRNKKGDLIKRQMGNVPKDTLIKRKKKRLAESRLRVNVISFCVPCIRFPSFREKRRHSRHH